MACQRKDEQGYAMAVLLVGIAIMLVFLGMALPVWNQQARRDREEELLFRLKQYAHAIALYQRRMPGAQPPSLDVLVEQRFLRRKYKDPITGEDFAILRVGQASPGMTTPLPGQRVPQPGISDPPGSGTSGPGATGARPGGLPGSQGGRSGTPLGAGSQAGVGGIRGVVSTSKESSIREWKGRTRYDQWEVTPEDIVPRFGPLTPDVNQPTTPGTGRTPTGQPMGPSLRPAG